MSDIGSALSSGLSGIGSAFSGGVDALGSAFSSMGGGVDAVGNAISGAGNALFGGGGSAPAAAASAVQNAVDPTGSIGASNTINPPSQGTPAQQQGDVGGTQSDPEAAPKPAPAPEQAKPVDISEEIRKLIRALRGPGMSQGVGGVGSRGTGSSAPYSEGASSQGEYSRPPLGLRPTPGGQFMPQWQGGEGQEPVDIPNMKSPPASAGGDELFPLDSGTPEGETVSGPRGPIKIGPGGWPSGTESWVEPPDVAGAVPGILRQIVPSAGGALTGAVGTYFGNTVPAETGELKPGQPGYGQQSALAPPGTGTTSYPQSTSYPQYQPGQVMTGQQPEVAREAEGGPAKEVKPTPKEKKADPNRPKGGDRYWLDDQGNKHWIDKDGNPLPTKKGHVSDRRPPGESQIIRDAAGMQGVPQLLGELAQLALPLILGGLGGGMMFGGRHGFRGFPFGRGGHGRFGGVYGGGHPGGFGSGMWPYHHPGMGWRGFGYHPGSGWRPLDPRFGPGGQSWQNRPFEGGVRQGPWSSNPFLSTLVGAESGGRNSGAPGQGPGGDGGIARGYFNIQTPTWRDFAPRIPGASQYASADQAPYEIQQAVANTIPISRFGDRTRRILHQRFGNFDERMTVGQLAGGGRQTAGKTPTGDERTPQGIATGNPDNPVFSGEGAYPG